MMRIRTVNKTSTLLKHFFQITLANEGWRPCVNDVDCFLEHEKAWFYVVEFQRKPFATMSVVKYGSEVNQVGSLIIPKDFRNLGYGKRIFQAIWQRHNESSAINKVWYATGLMAKFYNKNYGAVYQWPVDIYDLNVTRSLEKLQSYSTHFHLNQINENNINDVIAYDNKVFGYPRERFLRKWISSPGTHARVAFSKDGKILGYVVVRLAFFPTEGYKLGPLYCDNIEVGKSLIKSVFKDVHDHGFSHSNSVIIDSPTGRNPKAKELMESLEGKHLGCTYYQTTNDLPNSSFNQWFALLSSLFG